MRQGTSVTRNQSYQTRFWWATVKLRYTLSCDRYGAGFITYSEFTACWTCQHWPLHVASKGKHHIDIGFGQRNGEHCCISGGLTKQIRLFDIISLWNAICLSILLCASMEMISVTKFWDLIIHLYKCKGRTHHINCVESKSDCKTAHMCHYSLPITIEWDSESYISDEIDKQNWCEGCHMCHRQSSQCSIWNWLHDYRHPTFTHVSNWITLCTDLVRMAEKFEMSYGASWKSKRRSGMRKSKEVERYLPKTSERIYMPGIAGRKRRKVMGPWNFSLRYRGYRLIRHWAVTLLLDANHNTYKRNNVCE